MRPFPKGKVRVAFDQLSDARPIRRRRRLNVQAGETRQEGRLYPRSEARAHQVGYFSDDHGRDEEPDAGRFKHGQAALMVVIVSVHRSIKWPRINDGQQRPILSLECPPLHAPYCAGRFAPARRKAPPLLASLLLEGSLLTPRG